MHGNTTVTNAYGGYELQCTICGAAAHLQPPMPLEEFIRLIRKFDGEHAHTNSAADAATKESQHA